MNPVGQEMKDVGEPLGFTYVPHPRGEQHSTGTLRRDKLVAWETSDGFVSAILDYGHYTQHIKGTLREVLERTSR